MNPCILLAIAAGWAASLAGTGRWFYGAGKDAVVAQEAREDKIAGIATAAANKAAATAIAGIEVKNTTIRQTLEKEVHEKTVYRDCRSGPAAVGLLNASPAVAGVGALAAGAGQLPASGAAR